MRSARGEAILRVIAMRYAPQLIVLQNEGETRHYTGRLWRRRNAGESLSSYRLTKPRLLEQAYTKQRSVRQ
jgi:hypothetical protein